MSRVHSNNFSTTLNGAINNSVTSISVSSTTGFPAVGSGVTCNITVQSGTTVEIMKCTAISGATLTVVRAQESTSASAFADASTVEIRFTRDSVDSKLDTASFTDALISTSDITTNNSSTTKHGFLKKLSNTATEYMDGTGNWSVPAGSGGGSGALTLLSVQTASASSSLSFGSTLITSTYESYMFVIEALKTSGTTSINMNLSVDNGSTDVGPADWYSQSSIFVFNNGTIGGISAGTVSSNIATRGGSFVLTCGINTNNAASDLNGGTIYMHGPASASAQFEWSLSLSAVGGGRNTVTGGGQNISGYTPPINHVSFTPGTGTFTSGKIKLYGIQKV